MNQQQLQELNTMMAETELKDIDAQIDNLTVKSEMNGTVLSIDNSVVTSEDLSPNPPLIHIASQHHFIAKVMFQSIALL